MAHTLSCISASEHRVSWPVLFSELPPYSTLGMSSIVDVDVVVGRICHNIFHDGGLNSLAALRSITLRCIEGHFNRPIFADGAFVNMRCSGPINLRQGEVIAYLVFVR